MLKHELGRKAFAALFEIAYGKFGKDRQKTLNQMLRMTKEYISQTEVNLDYDLAEKMLLDENGALIKYINRVVDEVDKHALKTMFLNLGYEAMLCGTKIIEDTRKKEKCNIPWLILIDPTSACNLKCKGCWAAEYGNKLNLSFDEMNSIIEQGKKLGVFLYLYTGGEPLVRKNDLIKLCEKHSNCVFISFTNGTLVDEAFCKEMKRVGNLALALSLEGNQSANDERRGNGVFRKIMHSMDLLKENGCIFGTSICYTSKNIYDVTSDDFIQMEIDKGVKFSMYFHYMPVGNDADTKLLPTAAQRRLIYHRIREIRDMIKGKGFFCFDFQNDGEYVGGCIAGGRNYFHINANGDAEPCVFIHYSNMNIRDNTLLEILHSPLFMEYHNNQPFNENMLRPCPMLENPERLPEMVKRANAKSTDLKSPESAEHLCEKCLGYASEWAKTSERISRLTSVIRKNYKKQCHKSLRV